MDQNAQQVQSAPLPAAPAQPPTMPSQSVPQATVLPPIGQLFHESWELFKATFLQYTKFILLLVLIAFLVIGLPFGIYFIAPHLMDHLSSTISVIIVALVMSISIIFFFFPLMQFIMVAVVATNGAKIAVSQMIKRGMHFLLPLLAALLLSGLVVYGGLIAFIIPGIFFAIAFAFVPFVVVIEDKRSMAALKRSYFLAKSHFWPLVLRLFIGFIVTFSVNLVGNFIPIVNFFIGFIVSWFSFVWTYVVYKHIVSITPDKNEKVSFRWMWIIIAVGLVVVVLVVSASRWSPTARPFGNVPVTNQSYPALSPISPTLTPISPTLTPATSY